MTISHKPSSRNIRDAGFSPTCHLSAHIVGWQVLSSPAMKSSHNCWPGWVVIQLHLKGAKDKHPLLPNYPQSLISGKLYPLYTAVLYLERMKGGRGGRTNVLTTVYLSRPPDIYNNYAEVDHINVNSCKVFSCCIQSLDITKEFLKRNVRIEDQAKKCIWGI